MSSIPGGLSQGPGSETPNVAHLAKSYQTALGKVQQQQGSPIENMFLRVVKGNVEFVAREAGWKGRLQNFLARHNFGSYNVQRIAKALSTRASGEIPKETNLSEVALGVSSIFDRLHSSSTPLKVQRSAWQIRSTVVEAAGKTKDGLENDIRDDYKEIAAALGISNQDWVGVGLQPKSEESLSQFRNRLLESLYEHATSKPNFLQSWCDPGKSPALVFPSTSSLGNALYKKIDNWMITQKSYQLSPRLALQEQALAVCQRLKIDLEGKTFLNKKDTVEHFKGQINKMLVEGKASRDTIRDQLAQLPENFLAKELLQEYRPTYLSEEWFGHAPAPQSITPQTQQAIENSFQPLTKQQKDDLKNLTESSASALLALHKHAPKATYDEVRTVVRQNQQLTQENIDELAKDTTKPSVEGLIKAMNWQAPKAS